MITTENKRSDRHFKYFIIVQNFQQKGRGVSVFFNARKAEKATVSITFGELWFVLVLGPLDLWASGPKVHDIIIFKSQ